MQAQPAQPSMGGSRGAIIGGFVLVIVGAGALAAEYWPEFGRYIPLVVGLGLLALFAATRAYGALVAGSIVTGIGAGVVVSDFVGNSTAEGAVIVLGLGFGFVAIWVISSLMSLKESHWWPLIPGGILLLVGGGLALDLLTGDASRVVVPAAVVLIGLLVIIVGFTRTSRGQGGTST